MELEITFSSSSSSDNYPRLNAEGTDFGGWSKYFLQLFFFLPQPKADVTQRFSLAFFPSSPAGKKPHQKSIPINKKLHIMKSILFVRFKSEKLLFL